MKKILCFHGFLGFPSDFDFLKDHYDIHAPDLSDYVQLSYPQLLKKMNHEFNLNHCHLLGYSFGARLAARIFSDINSQCKLFMLAGHLGLESTKEIKERESVESDFIQKVQTYSDEEFLKYWNSLELFKWDDPIKVANLHNKDKYFLNYGLSKQPPLKEKLIKKKKNIKINYGELDQKYVTYATQKLPMFELRFWAETGHRLLQNKQKILDELKGFI